MSDHKDLEVTVLQPQENIEKENCLLISGSFNIYAWLRPLNSAYSSLDPNKISKVVFNVDLPLCSMFFNRKRLQEIDPKPETLEIFDKYLWDHSLSVEHQKDLSKDLTQKTKGTIVNLELLRFHQKKINSWILSLINDDGSKRFLSYTVEDPYRLKKIKHISRIGDGRYQIKFRAVGGFQSRYLKRYGKDFHGAGMLELQDVKGYSGEPYSFVLIHCGN